MNNNYLIKNGSCFNSEKECFEKRDLIISDGSITNDTSLDIPVDNIIDAKNKYVLPGLIDEHAHLNLYGSIIGANADTVCIPSGITTAVDGGTTGASGFELFYKANIVRYETDVLAYLNVSTFGNKSLCRHEEDHDPDDFREDLIITLFKNYSNVLRGLKVRMCKATLGNYGITPLRKAAEISKKIKSLGFHCPLIIHYDDLPEEVHLNEILSLLSTGDVIAHIFQTKGETIFENDGKVKDYVKSSSSKGIYMDACNGRVHWSFENIKKAISDDFYPNIISSDLVRVSEYIRPGFSLLHAMCVYSAAGMKTEQILKAVTYTPAKSLGMSEKIGTLNNGTQADVSIFDIKDTDMVFYDKFKMSQQGNKIFIPLMTMKKGRIAYRQIFF